MKIGKSSFRVYATPSPQSGRQRTIWRVAPLAALAVVWAVFFASSIRAQQRHGELRPERPVAQSLATEMGNAKILPNAEKDYRISVGDIIQVQIEDAPELSHPYRVNSTGCIEMPVLGLVEAQSKTTSELARLIAKELREQEYLNFPNVLVTIKQYNNQSFFIQGSVRLPGVYQAEGRPSLLTMIGMAGGLADDHGSTVFIIRPSKTKKQGSQPDDQTSKPQDQTSDSGQSAQLPAGATAPPAAEIRDGAGYELIKVNVSALYKGEIDQRLEPGDIVNVPRADVFFVTGEVKAPGSFPLKEGTTLRQAISLAQGMTFSAKPAQGVIFRENPALGSREEIKVDIGAIMSGKKEDILVRANDVIIIPNSRTKSIGGMLLQALGVNSARIPVRY